MSKGRRYLKKERRYKNFLFFYLIIVMFTFVNYTFSRYTATTSSTTTVTVAKFNILVNDKKLGEEEKFDLLLSSNSNSINNKIAPDSEGYFELEIDPTETHVALEYDIAFDLTNLNNENKLIDLTEYTVDGGTTLKTVPDDNKIVEEINLPATGAGFTEEDIVTLRVYWKWDQDIVNPTFNNTSIGVTSVVRQKVANGSES